MKREKIAIIGAGIAGLGSAYFLYKKYDLTIFEKNDYAGGHSNTEIVTEGDKQIAIDTAVVIHNKLNYPTLYRLLRELDVPTQVVSSTASFQHLPSGLEYAVPKINQIFAQPKNMLSLSFWRLLYEMLRFSKIAGEVLTNKRFASYTVAQYAKEKKLSEDFLQKFFLPAMSSIWSADQKLMRDFPILTQVQYFNNHGMLLPSLWEFIGKQHTHSWRGFVGGTIVYRKKLLSLFPNALRLNSPIKRVKRLAKGVEVVTQKNEKFLFDRVIFACHADEALALLADPTPLEKELLSVFKYKSNSVILHTDASVMPKNKKAWASFNSRLSIREGKFHIEQNYYMNMVGKLAAKKDYFLALDSDGAVDPKTILKTFSYSHPIYSVAAAKAQSRFQELNENGRIYFCGSYFRYGFHEDAFVSSLAVARRITGEHIWADQVILL